MLLYRTPNVVIDRHEWHAAVRIKDERISKVFYFRPNGGPRRNWLPLTSWVGHKPTSREWSKAFDPFKRHMMQAERSVVENARAAVRNIS